MKKVALAFFVLSVLMLSTSAFAANPDLFLSDQEITLFTGTSKSVELTVRNNQAAQDSFSILVFPSSINKVTNFPSPERVTADGGGNATSHISFTAFLDALETQIFFNVTVQSINTPSVIASRLIQVSVKRTVPVFISEVVVDKDNPKPEETVTTSVTVTNGGGLTSDRYVLETIVKKGTTVVKSYSNEVLPMPPTSAKQFNNTYTFGKYAQPGEYTVVAVLRDKAGQQVSTSEDLRKVSMTLSEVPSTTISEKSTRLGILDVKVTVKVKNEGNVPATNFYVTESVPFLARSVFSTEQNPDSVKMEGTSTVYGWFVASLAPGEEFTVVYHFNVWKIWGALVLIVGAVVVAFRYAFKVVLVKRVSHVAGLGKGKEIIVHLEIKNRGISEVKDVVIRDSVPPIAEVVERFHTIKPVVKKTTGGTAVIWRFDSLKGGEERVLTYTFRPRVDVFGAVRLPAASVMYSTRRHRTKTSYSTHVVVRRA